MATKIQNQQSQTRLSNLAIFWARFLIDKSQTKRKFEFHSKLQKKLSLKLTAILLTSLTVIGLGGSLIYFINSQLANAAVPSVTAVTPNTGPLAGGNNVVINGQNFTSQINVRPETISAGYYHTCALTTNNQAYCWGSGGFGRLGTGTVNNANTPALVLRGAIPDGVVLTQIVASLEHTCALGSNGKAYCWGLNTNGQLGDGTTVQSNIPVAVLQGAIPSDVNITSIHSLGIHTCALGSNNKAYCWGDNTLGQLGINSTVKQTQPVEVLNGAIPADVFITKLSVSYKHTCALGSDNKAYCWGAGGDGRLGNGTFVTQALTPVAIVQGDIPSDVYITEISNAAYHTCAFASNSKIYCWGYNSEGQLGNGNNTGLASPTEVLRGSIPADATLTNVSSGWYHTCTLVDNKQVYCWGYNNFNQLGNGTTTNSNVPVTVLQGSIPNNTALTQLVTGSNHSCVLDANKRIYCWGNNPVGQLGNGTTTNQSQPVTVSQGAMTADGLMVKFGNNYSPKVTWLSPTSLMATVPASTTGTVDIVVSNSATESTTFANGYTYTNVSISNITPNRGLITGGNTVTISGQNFANQTNIQPATVVAGGSHSCAIGLDNKVYCWGDNTYGQLGNGTTTASSTPVLISQGAIPNGVIITQLSVSPNAFTCGLGSNSKVYCWGLNYYGQLGNGVALGDFTPTTAPVAANQGAIPAGVNLTQIVTGNSHTCAFGSDSKAYCWGHNGHGQLGNTTTVNSSIPVLVTQGAIPAGVNLTLIVSRYYHTCGLASNAKYYCWGYNNSGQLGNGTTTNATAPTAISQGAMPNGVTIANVSVGGYHTCALGSDAKTYCWGLNNNGQLGDNTVNNSSVPVAVVPGAMPNGVTTVQLFSGILHSCVIASDSKTYCWGFNNNGQLGDGTTINSSAPVMVLQGAMPSNVTISQITVGLHTCALGSDAKAYCWGKNTTGQLGDGTTTNTSTPVAVVPGEMITTANLSVKFGNKPSSNVTWVSATEITVTVPASTAGAVDVTVSNSTNDSATLVNGYTYYTTPSAPQNLTAKPSFSTNATGQAQLDWNTAITNSTAVGGDGWDSIVNYKVEYCTSDSIGVCSGAWTAFAHPTSSANTITINGLPSSDSNYYAFRVSAINAAGTGAASTTVVSLASFLSLNANSEITLSVTPLSGGRMTSISTPVVVNTNSTNGYNLALSMIGGEQALISTSNPAQKILANSGSMMSPVLDLPLNTWGYRVDGLGGFGMGHNGIDPTQTETNITNSNYSWARVPAVSAPDTISTKTTAPTSPITTNVFYGMKVDPSKPAGNYSNRVIYTLVPRP